MFRLKSITEEQLYELNEYIKRISICAVQFEVCKTTFDKVYLLDRLTGKSMTLRSKRHLRKVLKLLKYVAEKQNILFADTIEILEIATSKETFFKRTIIEGVAIVSLIVLLGVVPL